MQSNVTPASVERLAISDPRLSCQQPLQCELFGGLQEADRQSCLDSKKFPLPLRSTLILVLEGEEDTYSCSWPKQLAVKHAANASQQAGQ